MSRGVPAVVSLSFGAGETHLSRGLILISVKPQNSTEVLNFFKSNDNS